MKNILLALCITLAMPLRSMGQEGGGTQALSDKYGFRDLQFETPLAAAKGMVPVKPGHDTYKLYTRPTDSKKVGGAQLSSIQYGFYKGKLSSISLRAKGYANAQALYKALAAQYGPGEQDEIGGYSWTDGRVLMGYRFNSRTSEGTATMLSNYMAEQQKADEERAAHGAAKDL